MILITSHLGAVCLMSSRLSKFGGASFIKCAVSDSGEHDDNSSAEQADVRRVVFLAFSAVANVIRIEDGVVARRYPGRSEQCVLELFVT